MRLSANLGFLWSELALPDAVRAAARAGFDAVECHWPYDVAPSDLRAALDETGLPLISLNTEKGDSFGRCGLDAGQARRDIDQALAYGASIGAQAVHVMAGISDAPDALDVFRDSLVYGCKLAAEAGMTVLIEPLNAHDVPGYVLADFDTAERLVQDVAARNLKIMLDCYHAGRMGLDAIALYARLKDSIGHIQFANVPDRGVPGEGMRATLSALETAGWRAPFGAEYRPDGETGDSLGWMKELAR